MDGRREGESARILFKLVELSGREKLRFDLDLRVPPVDNSEFSDGERPCDGTNGDLGE